MKPAIHLALALHNHQPVGNFDSVFAEAYDKAYLPMLAALERHPKVRLAIHNTGCLLDWLIANRPDYITRLRALVTKGQVEIMTGGYYEPILVSLPDVDKLGQINKLTTTIRKHFGTAPTGAWLAERIWEPHLPRMLNRAGVKYTIVDDTHFRYAGLTDEAMFGSYITEEQGESLKIFGTAKHLRYTLPWAPVPEVIAWLKKMAESPLVPGLYDNRIKVAVMGDDGEKFGMWPRTYKHCWQDGWIDELFTAFADNESWLTTTTPGDFAETQPDLGPIYLTAASYDEMTEWALPAQLSHDYIHLKHTLQEEKNDNVLQFMKGGFWRNFMVKYPEVNQMHKKALWVSRKLRLLPNSPAKDEALTKLWAAQCNCGYWHGLFGGIYLFHIRGINYRNLIDAESVADSAKGEGWVQVEEVDFDVDGQPETILSNTQQWLCFDPARGGALREWDYRPAPYNLLNTMSRYREGYHEDILLAAKNGTIQLQDNDGEVENVHGDTIKVKEMGLEKRLFVDWYRRGALQDHFWPASTTPEQVAQMGYTELGDFVSLPYTAVTTEKENAATLTLTRHGRVQQDGNDLPVTVIKAITLAADSAALQTSYTITNDSQTPLRTIFAIENNWGLEGGQNPLTYFEGLDDAHGQRHTLGQSGQSLGVAQFAIVSDIQTVHSRIDMAFTDESGQPKPATVWFFPLESVTNSESGYEANYQGTSINSCWLLDVAPGQSWHVRFEYALSLV